MRQIAFYILVIPILFVMMVSCGGNSGSGRKQGEIYGGCFKDKTCNERMTCDEEHNVCIKDETEPYSDDEDVKISDDEDVNMKLPKCTSKSETPCSDSSSGLIWSSSSNALVWENAVDFCDNLTEGGFSDWRLPSINEARTLIIDCIETMIGGRCGVTDNCLSSDCLDYSCGLCEPQADGYYSKIDKHTDSKLFWSASEVSGSTVRAWGIELYTAGIAAKFKNEYGVTRCVRGENHRQLCEGLPEHAFWNSASNIFSTWDGTSWHPSLQGIYNDTASTKECRFKCVSGYKWDGYKCKLDNSLPECGVDSQTPCINSSTGLIWSSKAVDQSWKDAAVRCLRHSVGGSNTWRLPTIDELRTLVKNCPNAEYGGECAVSEEKGLLAGYESGTRESCLCYDTDTEYNKFGDSGFFWSSSIRSDDPENIWGIFMGYISYGAYGRIGVEIIDSLQTYEHGNVRCVVM